MGKDRDYCCENTCGSYCILMLTLMIDRQTDRQIERRYGQNYIAIPPGPDLLSLLPQGKVPQCSPHPAKPHQPYIPGMHASFTRAVWIFPGVLWAGARLSRTLVVAAGFSRAEGVASRLVPGSRAVLVVLGCAVLLPGMRRRNVQLDRHNQHSCPRSPTSSGPQGAKHP